MSDIRQLYGQRNYGAARPGRGVGATDVERAADALLRKGERPTVEKVRAALGTGSPNTINPMLDAWWKTIGQRLDAGPAALHRLPEGVAHVAEALWMQALEEGRRRAAVERSKDERANDQERDSLEVRSHVLTLREGELDSRLRERERSLQHLEEQVKGLSTLLRKEQASRAMAESKITELLAEIQTLRGRMTLVLSKAIQKGKKQSRPRVVRKKSSVKVATRSRKRARKADYS